MIKNSDGEDYIEKIFQLILPIPPLEPFALRRLVQANLLENFPDEMLYAAPQDLSLPARREALFDTWVGRLIETPRDALRLCEAVKFGWPHLRGMGDFTDYVWLQLIKLKVPPLYSWVRIYARELGAYRDGGRVDSEDVSHLSKNLIQIFSSNRLPSRAGHTLMTYFLPGMGEFDAAPDKGEVFHFRHKEELKEYEEERRLGSPIHWRYYFAFDKPSYAVGEAEIGKFLKEAEENATAAADSLRELTGEKGRYEPKRLPLFLDQLALHLDKASSKSQIGLAEALSAMMDDVPFAQRNPFAPQDAWRKAAGLLKPAVSQRFKHIVETGKSICWLSFIIREQGFALGFINKNQSKPDRQWLTTERFKICAEALIDRYKSLGILEIFNQIEPIHILYAWKLFGNSSELKELISQAIKNNDVLIQALQAMRTRVVNSTHGLQLVLDESAARDFLDTEEAKERLNRISANASDEALRAAASDLLASWRDQIPH